MLYYLSQYILNAAQGTTWQDPLSGLRVSGDRDALKVGAVAVRVAVARLEEVGSGIGPGGAALLPGQLAQTVR